MALSGTGYVVLDMSHPHTHTTPTNFSTFALAQKAVSGSRGTTLDLKVILGKLSLRDLRLEKAAMPSLRSHRAFMSVDS